MTTFVSMANCPTSNITRSQADCDEGRRIRLKPNKSHEMRAMLECVGCRHVPKDDCVVVCGGLSRSAHEVIFGNGLDLVCQLWLNVRLL